jgi:hypothetical protein
MTQLLEYLASGAVLLFLFGYVLFFPEKAQIVAGWLWGIFGLIWRQADKRAVAYKVQGSVNSATRELLKSSPPFLLDGKLQIKWTSAEEVSTVLHGGEVVVFMRRSSHAHENTARALMAYIPGAVVPRARRYVDVQTMRAADLVLAKSILCQDGVDCAALDAFLGEFMDSACSSPELKRKIEELDEVDVHGWLGRILLAEFYFLGRKLYPSEPQASWMNEAEQFTEWLYRLAVRPAGSQSGSLVFRGRLISIGIILVAAKLRLKEEGLAPYRRRAKRLIYQDQVDAVYLLARDHNMSAAKELGADLSKDAFVETTDSYEYRLRPDFAAKHNLRRERAIVVSLRRKLRPTEWEIPTDMQDGEELAHETLDVSALEAQLANHIQAPPMRSPDWEQLSLPDHGGNKKQA